MHNIELILTLTGGLAAALILGYITLRLGLSPIVGYLLGGFIVGPHTPGFIANEAIADQLVEVGVILLMFGVGLQFHFDELLKARTVALALAQIGEFSFILAALGKQLGVLTDTAINALVAASIVSICLNPLLYRRIGGLEAWAQRHPSLWRWLNPRRQAERTPGGDSSMEEIEQRGRTDAPETTPSPEAGRPSSS